MKETLALLLINCKDAELRDFTTTTMENLNCLVEKVEKEKH